LGFAVLAQNYKTLFTIQFYLTKQTALLLRNSRKTFHPREMHKITFLFRIFLNTPNILSTRFEIYDLFHITLHRALTLKLAMFPYQQFNLDENLIANLEEVLEN
jgi:hypothetical protein